MLPFLDGYVIRDEFGLEAFAPTRGRNPLRELSPEDLFVFLDSLMGSGRYDTILLDVGAALSPLDTACLELAEKVCLIGAAEGSFFREAQYMQYLICRCGGAASGQVHQGGKPGVRVGAAANRRKSRRIERILFYR